jgi:alanyl-tRNA synthetase
MIEERKLGFDREGFDTAMEQQREKARAKSKFKTDARGGDAFTGFDSVPATTFTGYDNITTKTRVIALATLRDGGAPVEVQKLSSGETGWIVWKKRRSTCRARPGVGCRDAAQ